MTKYNDDVFKKMVKEVIIGGNEENGEYNPSLVRFVLNINFMRTGTLNNEIIFAPGCEHRLFKTSKV